MTKYRLFLIFASLVLAACGKDSSSSSLQTGSYSLGQSGSTALRLLVAGDGTYQAQGYLTGIGKWSTTESGSLGADGSTLTFTPGNPSSVAPVTCTLQASAMPCGGPPRAFDRTTSLLSGYTVDLTTYVANPAP